MYYKRPARGGNGLDLSGPKNSIRSQYALARKNPSVTLSGDELINSVTTQMRAYLHIPFVSKGQLVDFLVDVPVMAQIT